MALSLQQRAEFLGNDQWEWSVELAGAPEEMDAVDHVMYILHPTFKRPVREVSDRSTNFRLRTSGWGAFTINAKVMHKDGRQTALQHDLKLLYPDGTPTLA